MVKTPELFHHAPDASPVEDVGKMTPLLAFITPVTVAACDTASVPGIENALSNPTEKSVVMLAVLSIVRVPKTSVPEVVAPAIGRT